MVPPRPVALGVWISTPPISRMATTTSMITSAWLIWCMERTKCTGRGSGRAGPVAYAHRPRDRPEYRVARVPAPVVAHDVAEVGGEGARVAQQLVQGLARQHPVVVELAVVVGVVAPVEHVRGELEDLRVVA